MRRGKEMADNDILINILLDRSGSMHGLENDVIGNYNALIKEQREQEGEASVSLVLFDNEYEEVYINKNINTIPQLDESTYFVRGNTAYYDALGKLINSIDRQKNRPKKVMFVINTDGYENASREYTAKKLRDLIKSREKNRNWQFIFIGAGLDALKASVDIGIRNYIGVSAATPASFSYTSNVLRGVTNAYRGGVGSATINIQDNNTFEEPDAE